MEYNLLDHYFKPNKDYIKIAQPTLEEIGKLLSAIKTLQSKNEDISFYKNMISNMIDTFIEKPIDLQNLQTAQ